MSWGFIAWFSKSHYDSLHASPTFGAVCRMRRDRIEPMADQERSADVSIIVVFITILILLIVIAWMAHRMLSENGPIPVMDGPSPKFTPKTRSH
jgi:hypothetical protein